MNEVLVNRGRVSILAHGGLANMLTNEWFEPDGWRRTGAVRRHLGGRGQAVLVDSPAGPLVLRRFLRGGWVSRVRKDTFLNLGMQHSRAFREFRVLRELWDRGLPVPEPLAASHERHGVFYRAGLLTRLIPDARELADVAAELSGQQWNDLGATLERFFAVGLKHPDLNARNLLIDQSGQWYLLDLDRAVLTGRALDGRFMRRRLARSLEKLCPGAWQAGFDAANRRRS